MKSRMRGFRSMVIGSVVAAGLLLAPAAFARTHVSVGVGLPGVSVGYNSGWHGHGYGVVGVGGYGPYYGGYYGGYYPGYYAPAYYGPSAVVYGAPVYRGYYGRGYYGHGYYGHGRGDYHGH